MIDFAIGALIFVVVILVIALAGDSILTYFDK
jgi:hypothetical protein